LAIEAVLLPTDILLDEVHSVKEARATRKMTKFGVNYLNSILETRILESWMSGSWRTELISWKEHCESLPWKFRISSLKWMAAYQLVDGVYS
jgi:hypothetical protein